MDGHNTAETMYLQFSKTKELCCHLICYKYSSRVACGGTMNAIPYWCCSRLQHHEIQQIMTKQTMQQLRKKQDVALYMKNK
eukprot:scaffold16630_cov177-Amphora_coffeaeformis.AAC.4